MPLYQYNTCIRRGHSSSQAKLLAGSKEGMQMNVIPFPFVACTCAGLRLAVNCIRTMGDRSTVHTSSSHRNLLQSTERDDKTHKF
eukprot:6186243-Pleurochrysis_carterae.AAC.1